MNTISFLLQARYDEKTCQIWLIYEYMRILSIILGAIPQMAKR
jgi:hypothetical protein